MTTQREALKTAMKALEKVTKELLAIRNEIAENGIRPTSNLVYQKLWDSSFDVYVDHAIPAYEACEEALAHETSSHSDHYWSHEIDMAHIKGYQQGRASALKEAQAKPKLELLDNVEYAPCCTDQTCPKCKPTGSETMDWIHLKEFGYAPGGYMMRCMDCKKEVIGVDKRALRCKDCAEDLYKNKPQSEPVAWQHRKPVVDAYGNAVGYTDWMDGKGLDWWPHRSPKGMNMIKAIKHIVAEIDALPEGLEGYFSDSFADALSELRKAAKE